MIQGGRQSIAIDERLQHVRDTWMSQVQGSAALMHRDQTGRVIQDMAGGAICHHFSAS